MTLKILVPLLIVDDPFLAAGNPYPKPLAEILGKPMIQWTVDNVRPRRAHRFIFVCMTRHIREYALDRVLQLIAPGSTLITTDGQTGGALCTTLLAADELMDDGPLLIANADQYVDFAIDTYLDATVQADDDASLVTFPGTHPKWSYVRAEGQKVYEVAEKLPISPHAAVGISYFRSSHDYFDLATRCILKRPRSGGAFYVSQIFNEYILADMQVSHYPVPADKVFKFSAPINVEYFTLRRLRENRLDSGGDSREGS